MKYSIGIFLGQTDLYKEELIHFSSLKDLDTFTMKCINREDIVKKFVDEVSCFLVDHKRVVRNIEQRTGKKHNGRITAYYYDHDEIQYVKILYKGFNMLDYGDVVDTLRNEFLERIPIIRKKGYSTTQDADQFLSILKKYNVPVTEEQKYSLRMYASYQREKDLKDFFILFKQAFKRMSEEKKYLFLRNFSLIRAEHKETTKKEPLTTVKTKKGIVKVKKIPLEDLTVTHRTIEQQKEDYYRDLESKEDYEEILKYYDIDEIIGFSDGQEPFTARRKK